VVNSSARPTTSRTCSFSDGSQFTAAPPANPTLTIVSAGDRQADHIGARLPAQGNLIQVWFP